MCKFTMIILSFKLQKIQPIVQSHFHPKIGLEFDETFFSVLSNHQNSSSSPSPSLFLCKFGRITRPTFSNEVRIGLPPDLPWLLFCLFVSSGEWYMQTETCANPWPWTLTSKLVVIWQPFCQFIHLVKSNNYTNIMLLSVHDLSTNKSILNSE